MLELYRGGLLAKHPPYFGRYLGKVKMFWFVLATFHMEKLLPLQELF
jgi:hypothetical protein